MLVNLITIQWWVFFLCFSKCVGTMWVGAHGCCVGTAKLVTQGQEELTDSALE